MDRIHGLQALLTSLLSLEEVLARVLYALVGRMGSMALLLPLELLFKRSLQSQLAARWNRALGSWEDCISLIPWFGEAVYRWLDVTWLSAEVPITLGPPLVEVFTDASLEGWSAHCQDQVASGSWSSDQVLHINLLEMEAVSLAL
jgi:hypothetical protein